MRGGPVTRDELAHRIVLLAQECSSEQPCVSGLLQAVAGAIYADLEVELFENVVGPYIAGAIERLQKELNQ